MSKPVRYDLKVRLKRAYTDLNFAATSGILFSFAVLGSGASIAYLFPGVSTLPLGILSLAIPTIIWFSFNFSQSNRRIYKEKLDKTLTMLHAEFGSAHMPVGGGADVPSAVYLWLMNASTTQNPSSISGKHIPPYDFPVFPVGGTDNPTVRLRLTNYGTSPIVNVKSVFRLIWLEDKDVGGSHQTGATKFESIWPVTVPKIDPGADQSIEICFQNNSPFWLAISLTGEFFASLMCNKESVAIYPEIDSPAKNEEGMPMWFLTPGAYRPESASVGKTAKTKRSRKPKAT